MRSSERSCINCSRSARFSFQQIILFRDIRNLLPEFRHLAFSGHHQNALVREAVFQPVNCQLEKRSFSSQG
jgi:hypothetical protein